MTRIGIKRVYEAAQESDGYRVLVDKFWPRGVRKSALQYDLWAKQLAPSDELRRWYHADPAARWEEFSRRYTYELRHSAAVHDFVRQLAGAKSVYPALRFAQCGTKPCARVAGISRTGPAAPYNGLSSVIRGSPCPGSGR